MTRRALAALQLLCLLGAAAALPPGVTVLRKSKKRGRQDARLLVELAGAGDQVQAATARYLDNQQLTEWLQGYEKRCKAIARLAQIGSSTAGRPIWALEISDKPGQAEAEPAVKYVGNVHGDEPTGRVLTLALAEWLCANHKSDARAKRIVQSMHLWLVPAMNPDGFEARNRANKGGKDLNRDFPDRLGTPDMKPSGQEQPETKAIMDWSMATGFVASASMHEGALVANYPWDGTADRATRYEACPDDATFKHLASLYATSHRTMAKPDNPEFPHGGTTNGAAWYPIYGSMQDWNYVAAGCLELTLELSQSKWPAESELPQLWEDNKDALLAFPLAAAYGGLWGSVREEGKKLAPLGGANITVLGAGMSVPSRAGLGDYYRPLAPGRYTVAVSAEGFKPLLANVTVPADGSGTQRHFVLARTGSSGEGEAASSLKALGHGGGEGAAAGGAGGVLPWKAGRKGQAGGEKTVGPPGESGDIAVKTFSRSRDRWLLLGCGAGVVYGLIVTHTRLKRRTHQRLA